MRTDAAQIDHKRTGAAVPPGGADGLPRPDAVTPVLQHRVNPGAAAQYETWLQEITPATQRFPGHQGVNIIRPSEGADLYTIVLHFDTLEHLQGWLASETRRRLMAQVESLLVSGGARRHQDGTGVLVCPADARSEVSAAVQAIPPHVLSDFSADGARALGAQSAGSGGTRPRVAGRE